MKRMLMILSGVLLWSWWAAAQPADTLAPMAAAGPELPVAADEPTPENEAPAPESVLWDRANTAYLRADYRAAIRTYEELLGRGLVSGKLYYNLGNACFKDDQLGRAILCYRRALQFDPNDEDVRYNLAVAEGRTKDRIEAIPEFFLTGWLRTMRMWLGGTAWTVVSLVLLALTAACVLLYLLAQPLPLRKAGFWGMAAGAVLFAAATCCAAAARRQQLDRREAIVMSSAVSVKSSPDRAATDLFVLHEGTRLSLGDAVNDWREVTLPDGKKGWLESRHIEAI